VPDKVFGNTVQFHFKMLPTLIAKDLRVVKIYFELFFATGTRNNFAVLDKFFIKESVFHRKEILPTYI